MNAAKHLDHDPILDLPIVEETPTPVKQGTVLDSVSYAGGAPHSATIRCPQCLHEFNVRL